MILNKQQKEDFVIELLEKGITVPQIAKQAMFISQLKGDKKGQQEKQKKENSKKELSVSSQSLNIFFGQ